MAPLGESEDRPPFPCSRSSRDSRLLLLSQVLVIEIPISGVPGVLRRMQQKDVGVSSDETTADFQML